MIASPFVLALVLALSLAAQDSTAPPAAAAGEKTLSIIAGPAYPLDYCIVTGEKFSEAHPPYAYIRKGASNARTILLANKDCVAKFEEKADEYLAKIDAAVIATQKPTYPLEQCPVSGEPLDEGAVDYVYQNRLVRFCCKGCISGFEKDPKSHLEKINRAIVEAQRDTYPLTHCVVMPENELEEDEAVDYVHGTQLVRFCCRRCITRFEANPPLYLAKIREIGKGAK
ncbi:MAG: hypothetical protein AB1486_03700 [Planctomycetota bacterium]